MQIRAFTCVLKVFANKFRSESVGSDASGAVFVGQYVQNRCLLRLEVVDVFRIYRSGRFQRRLRWFVCFGPDHKGKIRGNVFFRPTEFSFFRFDGDLLGSGLRPETILRFGKQCRNRKAAAESVADRDAALPFCKRFHGGFAKRSAQLKRSLALNIFLNVHDFLRDSVG